MTRAMLRFYLTALALSAFGCGSPPEAQPDASESTPLDDAETPAPDANEPEGCGMVFSPVPELRRATEIAAARWSAATGCDVRVGEGGVPLRALPLVFAVQDSRGIRVAGEPIDGGEQLCGASFGRIGESITWQVSIATATPGCPSAEHIVTHETGHVLRADYGHSNGGSMQVPLLGGPIEETSLGFVCSGFPCAGFNPEPEPD